MRDDLTWREKLSIAWEVFTTILAWVGMVFYILAVAVGVGAFLYCLFSGKLF